MIIGLHHTGLSVADLDSAIRFYTVDRAFELVRRFEIEDTAENRAMLQVDHAGASVAFLKGTLGCLELFQFTQREAIDAPPREVYSAGLRHVCLQTAISDRLYEDCLAAGASAHARPAGLGTGNSYVYIRDPEQNILELEGVPWSPGDIDQPWFAHTAIVTPDLKRLASFYADLTGVNVRHGGKFGPDKKFDTVAGLPDIEFQGAWLRLANAEVEFWSYHHPMTAAVPDRDARCLGWNHLCFETDSIDEDFRRLEALGVSLHGPPRDFGVATCLYGRDPDGNIFELLQPSGEASVTIGALLAAPAGEKVAAARRAFRGEVGSAAVDPT